MKAGRRMAGILTAAMLALAAAAPRGDVQALLRQERGKAKELAAVLAGRADAVILGRVTTKREDHGTEPPLVSSTLAVERAFKGERVGGEITLRVPMGPVAHPAVWQPGVPPGPAWAEDPPLPEGTRAIFFLRRAGEGFAPVSAMEILQAQATERARRGAPALDPGDPRALVDLMSLSMAGVTPWWPIVAGAGGDAVAYPQSLALVTGTSGSIPLDEFAREWIAAPAAGPPPVPAPGARARLSLRGVPLADALDALKATLGLAYAAQDAALAAAKPVTLEGEFTLEEALAETARQAGVSIERGRDGIAVIRPAPEGRRPR